MKMTYVHVDACIIILSLITLAITLLRIHKPYAICAKVLKTDKQIAQDRSIAEDALKSKDTSVINALVPGGLKINAKWLIDNRNNSSRLTPEEVQERRKNNSNNGITVWSNIIHSSNEQPTTDNSEEYIKHAFVVAMLSRIAQLNKGMVIEVFYDTEHEDLYLINITGTHNSMFTYDYRANKFIRWFFFSAKRMAQYEALRG